MANPLSESEKRLLRKLHESEHFMEQVANHSPDIIYVLDIRKNRYTYTNKRVKEIMGAENILMDKIHPQDHDLRREHIAKCAHLKKDETLDIDIRMRVKCGSWHWFWVRDIAFQFDLFGEATHTIGVARDIQEYKVWEETLSGKNEMLSRVLNVQSVKIVACRAIRNQRGTILDFEFILVSKAFEKFHQKENLCGKWAFEEFPEMKKEYRMWSQVIEKEEVIRSEISMPNPQNGKLHWFDVKAEKFGDGLMVVWDDITEQKESQLQIFEQAKFIENITHTLPDVVTVIEFPSRRVEFINRDPLLAAGHTPEEIQAMAPEKRRTALIHPADQRALIDYYARIENLRNSSIETVEYRARQKNGGESWMKVRGKVIGWHDDGTPHRTLHFGQDITEQKIAEKKIKEQTAFIEAIVAAFPGDIWVMSFPAKRIEFANKPLANGYTLDEFNALKPDERIDLFVFEDDTAAVKDFYKKLASLPYNETITVEYRFCRNGKSLVWYRLCGKTLLRNTAGTEVRSLLMGQDISSEKMAAPSAAS